MINVANNVVDVFKEFFLLISYPFTGLLFSLVYNERKSDAIYGQKRIIVIVKSWTNNNILHVYWKNYLEKRGFRVHLINLPIQRGDFESKAKQLKDFIDSKNLKDITLVGISGGGITSYYYLQNYNGWDNVRSFISVGTPFKGMPIATILSFWISGKELLPASKFIDKLYINNIKNVNKIVCVKAKVDEFVPGWSSFIPGARSIVIDLFGHNNLHLGTRKTYDTIIEIASE